MLTGRQVELEGNLHIQAQVSRGEPPHVLQGGHAGPGAAVWPRGRRGGCSLNPAQGLAAQGRALPEAGLVLLLAQPPHQLSLAGFHRRTVHGNGRAATARATEPTDDPQSMRLWLAEAELNLTFCRVPLGTHPLESLRPRRLLQDIARTILLIWPSG